MVKSLMHWLKPYNRKNQQHVKSDSSTCSSHNLTEPSSAKKASENESGKIRLHKAKDMENPIDNPFILTGRKNLLKSFFPVLA